MRAFMKHESRPLRTPGCRMNKIEKLIEKLCPEGVEYKALGEIGKITRGRVMSKEYIQDNSGKYPVFSSQTANNGVLANINTYDYNGEYLTWTTDGANAGSVFYRTGKFSITNVCKLISVKTNILSTRFLYYSLGILTKNFVNTGMGNPKLMSNVISQIPIPVPPLAIQQEIVNILDQFSEREAELKARKQQYEYYCDQLLTSRNVNGKWILNNGVEVEWNTLGEIGEFIRGNGLQKKDFTETGVGCIHYGQIYTYYGTFTDETKSFVSPELAKGLCKVSSGNLIITCTSENMEDICKAVAWLGQEDIVTGGHSAIFKHKQNPKYIAYFFQTEEFFNQKKKYARGTKVIEIKTKDLEKIRIPLPPLAEQKRIVAILDSFNALVNDISEGLPAEIAARHTQYEHYRNKLLEFKRKAE